MTSNEPMVELTDVRLSYRLAKQRIPSFKEYAIHWMKGSLTYETLWALKGIDFTLRRGDSLGLVGRNGAGKSSLLKVISGVLRPTHGRCVVSGSVAPILELGTGFDYELTGSENIELNALLLGRSRSEIRREFDRIVEFSGLDEFIDSPIRNYSSGMVARLGFAIATAWRSDVLILDEVLSVGDARFRQRCEERIQELVDGGVALLYVSHDAASVLELCEQALWLERGDPRLLGPAPEVVEAYEAFASAV